MDGIWPYRMSTKVFDRFYLISLVSNLYLVRLHHLLNCCTDVTQTHVDSSSLNAFIRGLFSRSQKVIINRIKRHSKGAINNVAIDLGSKIDLAHIIIIENSVVARVWSVMCCTFVDTTACWEPNALLYTSSLN